MPELDPRIRIRAPLRCDGIGRLDCAEDTDTGGRLAVRWLPLEANGTAAAEACAQLPEHPTLPKIRQTGTLGDKAFVAMDFPDGQLMSAFAGEVLPSGQLISIVAQIADALATMHAQDTVHGELSAESVLLVKPELTEKAYLWDMPLVIANRITDRRGEERLMHQLVKTAAYLSPERARGGRATPAGDVYALGAIVCVASGCELPKADNTLGVVHAVGQGTWVPKVSKSIPEPLRSMVDRMVSSDPAQRPTAREVADLFMPPVAATPTLREMAVQLPPEVLAKAEAMAKSSSDTLGRQVEKPSSAMATGPQLPSLELTVLPPTTRVQTPPALVAPPVLMPVAAAPVAVAPPPAPVVEAARVAPVALTDNLTVSAELAADGAAVLSPEEAAALDARSRRMPLVLAATMGGMAMALLAVVLWLAFRTTSPEMVSPVTPVLPQNQPMVSPTVSAPAPAVKGTSTDADLLAPLESKKASRKASKPAMSSEPMADQSTQTEPVQESRKPESFEFLNDGPELKRPNF